MKCEATLCADLLPRFKARVQAGEADLREQYLAEPDVAGFLQQRSQLIDEVLCDLWRAMQLPDVLALVAVGGYGRGELWPESDIDLLLLLPVSADGRLSEQIEQLIALCWDIGLELGHSVRTVGECLEEAQADLTVQTALAEARLLTGDSALFATLRAEFNSTLDPQSFFHTKLIEQHERYVRYQESPYSLEPNIKESPGGLRDLQAIIWIAQTAGFGKSWQDLHQHGFITDPEAQGLARRERFLQGLRIELHLLAGRREDRLLFDYQAALAERLGLADLSTRRASEQLMQEYYRTAKAVMQLNSILLQNLGAAIFPAPKQAPSPINERFQNTRQLLDVCHEDVFNQNRSAILEVFLLMQQRAELKGMTARTIRALWRARTLVDESFRQNPAHQALFVEIFKQPRGVLHELRRMNQFDILGRYLPNFGEIVGQMQHDLFHAYTVDQHTLLVLRNLRRFSALEFAHEYPFCSQLMANFARPWRLYLAAIFHDIAKGRGGGHSERGARDTEVFCASHHIPPEEAELIVWLVRHHLVMSDVAQKQDCSDPDVIARFAALVGDETHLIALYLFSVADIRATSPKVWNSWKGQLLEALFSQTRQLLRSGGKTPARQGIIEERQEGAREILRYHGLLKDEHLALWEQLNPVYFLLHSDEEIAWHARALHYRVNSERPVVKARVNLRGGGIEVMVYTPDQPDLFARLAGFFGRAGYNIMDAKIHTTHHAYALDSYMLQDVEERERDKDRLHYIEHELADRLTRQTPLDAPITKLVSRQLKHFPIQTQVAIRPDERGRHFILTVSAADRPGLLYTVAMTLAEHGVHLHTAKIATLGERVEDTFLISGDDLNEEEDRIKLESQLLSQLKS